MGKVVESLLGYHISSSPEQAWEYVVDVPVDSLEGRTFPSWVAQQPIKLGGLGLRSQEGLSPVAYLACLEQTIPFFTGDRGSARPSPTWLVGRRMGSSGGGSPLLIRGVGQGGR